MPDHVHLLYLQNPNKTVAETIKQVKGSVSHWINKNDIINSKFVWQTGYGVFQVSESQLEKVYSYIKNQKEHLLEKSFNEEFTEYFEKYKLSAAGGHTIRDNK